MPFRSQRIVKGAIIAASWFAGGVVSGLFIGAVVGWAIRTHA